MATPPTAAAGAGSASDWLKQDRRRLLHVVYRVGDMDKAVDFYTKALGMRLLRFRDIPEGKYSNAFLGYNDEEQGFALEVRCRSVSVVLW